MNQYWPGDDLTVADDIDKQHGCALDSRFQACFNKQQSTHFTLQVMLYIPHADLTLETRVTGTVRRFGK